MPGYPTPSKDDVIDIHGDDVGLICIYPTRAWQRAAAITAKIADNNSEAGGGWAEVVVIEDDWGELQISRTTLEEGLGKLLPRWYWMRDTDPNFTEPEPATIFGPSMSFSC